MKIGIDFGTSTSEIGYIDKDGNITVIKNHLGEEITPSVVYIAEDGEIIVGREAKEKAIIEPENTFIEVKRLFGQDKQLTARGKTFTPPEVGAEIMKYLVKCAENEGIKVDSAVITVPAYFTDSQRKDVMNAGKAAGLNVERIINEPTAASLDYGISHMNDCKNILVYDLGGGTLDVTVLELFEGVVDVKASCGNNELGGKDFDQAIIDYIISKIKDYDIKKDARAMMRVKMRAEDCKIALSENTEFTVDLPFLYSKKDGSPAGFTETITRKSFEKMIEKKIFSTKQQIDSVLFDAELIPSDIDLTLLVGGSTRIPLVKKFLDETFNFKAEEMTSPDLAVVRGASIQAGVLDGTIEDNAIVLMDICPYSLSTEVLSDFTGLFCDILIPRNTTLPASVSKEYATACDDQKQVHITAYQGESDDPDENYLLGCFELSGIPKAKAHKESINITFEYDLNGILTVSGEIVSTGKIATLNIDTSKMGQNLDLSAWKEAPNAKKYKQLINKADRLVKIHGDDAEDIENASNELKKALVLGWDNAVTEHLEHNLSMFIKNSEF